MLMKNVCSEEIVCNLAYKMNSKSLPCDEIINHVA